MQNASRRRFKRTIIVPLGVVVCTWVALTFGIQLVPKWIGPHREFFNRCDGIVLGSDSRSVLVVMRGYVLARREGNRVVDDALVNTRTTPSRDRLGEESYLFYPADSESANWCVVYFQGGRVVRTALLPD
jgi:hypothetical protein